MCLIVYYTNPWWYIFEVYITNTLPQLYEQIPVGRDQIYHEVELGVVIGKTGVSISESQAMDHVGGYTLALDMTDLDLILEKVSKQSGDDTYVILCDR